MRGDGAVRRQRPPVRLVRRSSWPGDEAADELCEAILDDDDADVWDLGFEALGMIDRDAAEPAVRRLRSRPGLRQRATAWLRAQTPNPPPLR